MRKQKPSILIVDDYPILRHGLKEILQNEYSNAEFDEAGDAEEALLKMVKRKWDLVILDINMPGRDGLELLEQFKAEGRKLPVLVLSMHPEDHMSLRALRAGASGYMNKVSAGRDLLNAVEKIMNGHKYITAGIAEKMADEMAYPEGKKPHERLSNREYETALLLAAGKSVSAIANQLSLSLSTISTYRVRILEKMNLRNNAELISYFVRHALH